MKKKLNLPIPSLPKLFLPYRLIIAQGKCKSTSKVSTSILNTSKLSIANSSKQDMQDIKGVRRVKIDIPMMLQPQIKKLIENAGFGK